MNLVVAYIDKHLSAVFVTYPLTICQHTNYLLWPYFRSAQLLAAGCHWVGAIALPALCARIVTSWRELYLYLYLCRVYLCTFVCGLLEDSDVAQRT